jgi:hypothetical protein
LSHWHLPSFSFHLSASKEPLILLERNTSPVLGWMTATTAVHMGQFNSTDIQFICICTISVCQNAMNIDVLFFVFLFRVIFNIFTKNPIYVLLLCNTNLDFWYEMLWTLSFYKLLSKDNVLLDFVSCVGNTTPYKTNIVSGPASPQNIPVMYAFFSPVLNA